MQWINQAVILEAKVLLKHSNLLVFQISDELNFPNPSFFSKFFKRMTGMTPAEYQKQCSIFHNKEKKLLMCAHSSLLHERRIPFRV